MRRMREALLGRQKLAAILLHQAQGRFQQPREETNQWPSPPRGSASIGLRAVAARAPERRDRICRRSSPSSQEIRGSMTNFDHKARIEEAKRILIDSWQRKAKAKPEELKRTYHSETHSDVGGRFAVVNRTVVTGRGEPPTYAAPNWA